MSVLRIEDEPLLTKFCIDHFTDAMFWISKDGHFKFVNDVACKRLGYSREELLSMTLHDLDPNFPPSMWASHWDELKRIGGKSFETEHRRKDGTFIPVEVTTNHFEFKGNEYHFACARDLTIRRKIEKDLKESEEQFRTIFNAATDGIAVADIETKKIYLANAAMCSMLGYSGEEMVQMSATGFHPKGMVDAVMKEFDKQASGNTSMAMDIPMLRKDGSVFYADVNSVALHMKGRPCLMGMFRDVSDHKRAEDELKRKIYELETLNKIMLGREERIIELKEEIKRLKANKVEQAS